MYGENDPLKDQGAILTKLFANSLAVCEHAHILIYKNTHKCRMLALTVVVCESTHAAANRMCQSMSVLTQSSIWKQ